MNYWVRLYSNRVMLNHILFCIIKLMWTLDTVSKINVNRQQEILIFHKALHSIWKRVQPIRDNTFLIKTKRCIMDRLSTGKYTSAMVHLLLYNTSYWK